MAAHASSRMIFRIGFRICHVGFADSSVASISIAPPETVNGTDGASVLWFCIHVHAKATLMPPFESLDLARNASICKTNPKSEECSRAHARGIPDTLGESRLGSAAIVGFFDAPVPTGDGPFRFFFLLFP